MHYYEHHLGDWAAATSHLTWDEDMAYTRLLRAYYHAERAIPEGQQYRLAKASTPAQRKAVDAVLKEFFTLVDICHRQKRADAEIERFQDKQRKAKASANARWAHTERNANAYRTQCEGNAPIHHTPDTSHQSPDKETHTPQRLSDGGRVCLLLRQAGLTGVNPGHPGLLALISAGCTDEEFVGAGTSAAQRGKGFAYAIGTLKKQREEAAAAVLHQGRMPATETPYARQMREKYESIVPSAAAKKPGTVVPFTVEMEPANAAARLLG